VKEIDNTIIKLKTSTSLRGAAEAIQMSVSKNGLLHFVRNELC